jgi:hypothetical protein
MDEPLSREREREERAQLAEGEGFPSEMEGQDPHPGPLPHSRRGRVGEAFFLGSLSRWERVRVRAV